MNEFELRRPPPPSPYRPSGRVLHAPAPALTVTIAALRKRTGRESACFWVGTIDDDGHGQVRAIVIPRQVNSPFNYTVPTDAMKEVATTCRARGWTIVGAVHTHPGLAVEHSRYDDQMTPSRRAVSLVIPMYGKWKGDWPNGFGIHEFVGGYWHLLSPQAATSRLQFTDDAQPELLEMK